MIGCLIFEATDFLSKWKGGKVRYEGTSDKVGDVMVCIARPSYRFPLLEGALVF